VNYKKEKIESFLKEYGFKATLIDQKDPKGTGHAILSCEEFVGKESFVVCMGDNIWSSHDFKRMNVPDEYSHIATLHSKDWKKYGVLVDNGGFLVGMHEKPQKFVSDLINTGLYTFTPQVFSMLKKIKPSIRGEYEINDAILKLAELKKVKIVYLDDYWVDFGCPEDIPLVEEFLKKEKLL
jgi:dTDP-glucose pyrophosphorylase